GIVIIGKAAGVILNCANEIDASVAVDVAQGDDGGLIAGVGGADGKVGLRGRDVDRVSDLGGEVNAVGAGDFGGGSAVAVQGDEDVDHVERGNARGPFDREDGVGIGRI